MNKMPINKLGFDLQINNPALDLLKKQQEWGTYYIGKFYFTIATNKKRVEVGLTKSNTELEIEYQRQLQNDNYPALFHEYIHYLHELSTVIGNAGLGIDLSAKSIFTHWLDNNPQSAISNGYTNNELGEKYAKAFTTQGVLVGDINHVFSGKFIEVESIDYVMQHVHFPIGTDFQTGELLIPQIQFIELVDKKIRNNSLMFGKYFIYEGIAYELDRVVDMQIKGLKKISDESKGTEYTVLRRVAQYIFPEIEKNVYLALGSMSLQFIDCGNIFIKMAEEVRDNFRNGFSQTNSVRLIKDKVIELLKEKRESFINAQEEYKNIFLKRKMLSKAFEFLTDKMKRLYDERIKNPSFEVDLVFEGKHLDILSIANICDYMYLFTDEDDYMRDFLGTSIDLETSMSLKTLLSYDDFYKAHYFQPTSSVELDEHMCPFFRCCNLDLRTGNPEICRTKPWRIFELSAKTDNKYCWYGQGVLEMKGVNE